MELVLTAGAAGDIGSSIRPDLRDEHRLRPQYRPRPLEGLGESEEAVQGNIEDMTSGETMVQGVDAILHLAAERRADASWEQVHGPEHCRYLQCA